MGVRVLLLMLLLLSEVGVLVRSVLGELMSVPMLMSSMQMLLLLRCVAPPPLRSHLRRRRSRSVRR